MPSSGVFEDSYSVLISLFLKQGFPMKLRLVLTLASSYLSLPSSTEERACSLWQWEGPTVKAARLQWWQKPALKWRSRLNIAVLEHWERWIKGFAAGCSHQAPLATSHTLQPALHLLPWPPLQWPTPTSVSWPLSLSLWYLACSSSLFFKGIIT